MTAAASTPLDQAKQLIMQRIEEEDNVTFDELEWLFDRHKLYQEVGDDKQIQTWDIWFNDEKLFLWRTTNKLLVEAWNELASERRFDISSTSFHTYGSYMARHGGFPKGMEIAPRNVWRNAGNPGTSPLKKLYFVPVIMCRKTKEEWIGVADVVAK